MTNGSAKGNDPVAWDKLLADLDEKLQLGLLTRLRRVAGYHLEGDILYIEPGSTDDESYLSKAATLQQLSLLAHDAIGVQTVKLKSRG
jgi:hypothetical protein